MFISGGHISISISNHEHPAKGRQNGGRVQKETSPDKIKWLVSQNQDEIAEFKKGCDIVTMLDNVVNCPITETLISGVGDPGAHLTLGHSRSRFNSLVTD